MTKQNENTENNGLIPTEQADLDFYKSLGGGALDDLGQHDIVMPRYKLVQNTSKTGTPGKWSSNLNPDVELDELDFVIFSIANFRVLFPEAGEGDKPLCRSNDGLKKSNESGCGDANCEHCRFAVWGKDERSGKPKPPKCRSGYTLMGMVLLPDGSPEPAMISIKGTAIKPAKQFFTRMRSKNIPPFAYITKLGATSTVNDKGRFYVPTFEFGDFLSKEAALDAAAQVKMYAGFAKSDAMIDAEDEDSHVSTGSPSAGAQSFLDTLNNSDGMMPIEKDEDIPF